MGVTVFFIKLVIFKAFDFVFISKLVDCLVELKVLEWLVYGYIRTMWRAKAAPTVDGQQGDFVQTTRGLKQGRTQSLSDSCVVLSSAIERSVKKWKEQNIGLQNG